MCGIETYFIWFEPRSIGVKDCVSEEAKKKALVLRVYTCVKVVGRNRDKERRGIV